VAGVSEAEADGDVERRGVAVQDEPAGRAIPPDPILASSEHEVEVSGLVEPSARATFDPADEGGGPAGDEARHVRWTHMIRNVARRNVVERVQAEAVPPDTLARQRRDDGKQ